MREGDADECVTFVRSEERVDLQTECCNLIMPDGAGHQFKCQRKMAEPNPACELEENLPSERCQRA